MGAARDYYDDLEIRDPAEREAAQMAALPGQIAHAQKNAPAFSGILKGIDPRAIDSRAALAGLPVTHKSDMIELQKKDPPLGGFAGTPAGELAHIFASPGPIYEPQGHQPDYWRTARALYAAGFRKGDIVHNTFSYHLTPAGLMLESGAQAIGCVVVPGGIGNTEQQLMAIRDIRPSGYTGTPSFLKILIEKARQTSVDISSITRALVGGEALPPSLREELRGHGVDVLQCYATADIGLIAYESPAMEGMIMDEGVILEIVKPGTGDPVPEGEVGELVITSFDPAYPLIRFGTGDLSAVLPGPSPCGRTNLRIKGWMGRADQTTKVRGMFVHPSQIAELIDRHPEIKRARLVVSSEDNRDVAILQCETEGATGPAEDIAGSIQAVCKVRGEVRFVEPGSLPNDGKVIDDVRTYE